jgi:hypothetical protein
MQRSVLGGAVAHVELSLSEPQLPSEAEPSKIEPPGIEPAGVGSLGRWAKAVSTAVEPCMVIDDLSVIVAISQAAGALFGFAGPGSALHRSLFAGVLRLLDFTATPALLPESELERIPPVLAYSSQRLARGLLRVRSGTDVLIIDAVSSPLFDAGRAVGSLTFFSQI